MLFDFGKYTYTHERTHARKHARTNAREQARKYVSADMKHSQQCAIAAS